MMKIEIYRCGDTTLLQNAINSFLASRRNHINLIDIKYLMNDTDIAAIIEYEVI